VPESERANWKNWRQDSSTEAGSRRKDSYRPATYPSLKALMIGVEVGADMMAAI
jgi:hypothetical protein